jgi:hypothetical protein
MGGIYSLQPLPSCWLNLLAMGTPDSAMVHRTVRWRTGQCGGAPDSAVAHRTVRWRTGQCGGAPDMHCSLSGACHVSTPIEVWSDLTVGTFVL